MSQQVHQQNITIPQGANFKVTHIWKQANTDPIDLTGANLVMQVKRTYADPEVLLEASTYNGYITTVPTQGKISINIPASETRDLLFTEGVYDLVVIWADGQVDRIVQGRATLSSGVSLTWQV